MKINDFHDVESKNQQNGKKEKKKNSSKYQKILKQLNFNLFYGILFQTVSSLNGKCCDAVFLFQAPLLTTIYELPQTILLKAYLA